MIKFCKEKWDKNKGLLEKALRERTDLNSCEYKTLVEMVVKYIFNDGEEWHTYDYHGKAYRDDRVTEIDDGDYQGTLLFLIPNADYQPSENDYLMTYVGYGSCSGCDTLQSIQDCFYGETLTDDQISHFMNLCKDIVQNTIKPYNYGWRSNGEFDPAEEDV